MIAKDLSELNGANKINKETALNEKGEVVNGFGDLPNPHDMLTGSSLTALRLQGRPHLQELDVEHHGAAKLGHSDVNGPATNPTSRSPGTPRIPRADRKAVARQADLKNAPAATGLLLYVLSVN